MKFVVKVDNEPAYRAFREVRRDIGKDVKKVMLAVGNEYALPTAKTLAPSILKPQVKVGATTRDLYFTGSGTGWKRARYWYLQFGGAIRKPFVATRPVPIKEPGGQLIGFRMSVKNPRRFKGFHFLEKARDKVRPVVILELERRIPIAIQARLDRHNVFPDRIVI